MNRLTTWGQALICALALTVAACACYSGAPPAAVVSPPATHEVSAGFVASLPPDLAALKPGHFNRDAVLLMEGRKCKGGLRGSHECKETTGDGRQVWAIHDPLAYRTLDGDLILMRPGMSTDLASIPRVARILLPSDGSYAQAALPHDLCYQSKGYFTWRGHLGHAWAQPYTRAGCDHLIDEAMEAVHTPKWERIVIVAAVRVGGGAGWGA